MSVLLQLMCYFTWIVCFGKLLPACNGFDRLKATRASGKQIPHSPPSGGGSHIPSRLSDSPCSRDSPAPHTSQEESPAVYPGLFKTLNTPSFHFLPQKVPLTEIGYEADTAGLGRASALAWAPFLPHPRRPRLMVGGPCRSHCAPWAASRDAMLLERKKVTKQEKRAERKKKHCILLFFFSENNQRDILGAT